MRVLVTGSRGRIGRSIVPELERRHEVISVDLRAPWRGPMIRSDVSRRAGRLSRMVGRRRARWERAFDGVDAVLHLAGAASPKATWPEVLRGNVRATWNVLEAAAASGVSRVVFASSLWPVRRILEAHGRSGLPQDPEVIAPTCPYGVTKAVCEMFGRTFVTSGRIRSFVAVRIGIFHRKNPKSDPWGVHVRPDQLWNVLREGLEDDLEGFHLRYAIGDGPAPQGAWTAVHADASAMRPGALAS